MPVYVYICKNHKEPLNAFIERSIYDTELIPKCESCGNSMVRRFDAPPITFMGRGWASKDK
jgi:predicted nucleic acid-binding Zn ribbon protein